MLILCNAPSAHAFADITERFTSRLQQGRAFIQADRHTLTELLPQADILITERLTSDMVAAAERLRAVVIPYTGADALPLELLAERGITLINNHGNSRAVAERALALALSLLGRIVEMDTSLRQGDWGRRKVDSEAVRAQAECDGRFTCWTSLVGRAVTILGTGSIGCDIARFLKVFDCRITGYNHSGTLKDPDALGLFSRVTSELDEALGQADVIFCALPLTPETRDLIHEGNIHLLRSKYLINIARGAIFEEQALFDSLSAPSGEGLAGAALDTWYQYPRPFYAKAFPSQYPFHTLSHVILSPHAASQTSEGLRSQIAEAFRSLEAYLAGDRVETVDLTRGY